MAEEDGYFAFGDVAEAICDKMERRHPHVFGSDEDKANFDPVGFWERIKAEEKSSISRNDTDGSLKGVPLALPALIRAVKLQDKAARTGFDWPDMGPVFEKVREEIGELEEATNLEDPSRRKIAEEFGDLLFVIANLGRHLQLDPEECLRQANAKFTGRFEKVEQRVRRSSEPGPPWPLKVMDEAWDAVKRDEGGES